MPLTSKIGKSILIIEDDRHLSEALKNSLTDAGYSVVTSTRPNEAMVKLQRQKFSCIIVDIQLEGYSGLKVVQQVRHDHARDTLNFETPIILMSGHLQSEHIRLTAGKVQAVLAKPFDLDTILGKVNELTGDATLIKKYIGTASR